MDHLVPVQLEPSSLYVVTTQTMGPVGKFHWAFYLTDSKGGATRLHWTTSGYGAATAEHVGYYYISQPSTYTEEAGVAFAFVKISGLEPTMGVDDLLQMFQGIFDPADGFPSIRENRARGITCRTWLLRVVEKLVKAGWIRRPDGSPAMENMEAFIVEKSMEQEALVSRGEFERALVTVF